MPVICSKHVTKYGSSAVALNTLGDCKKLLFRGEQTAAVTAKSHLLLQLPVCFQPKLCLFPVSPLPGSLTAHTLRFFGHPGLLLSIREWREAIYFPCISQLVSRIDVAAEYTRQTGCPAPLPRTETIARKHHHTKLPSKKTVVHGGSRCTNYIAKQYESCAIF